MSYTPAVKLEGHVLLPIAAGQTAVRNLELYRASEDGAPGGPAMAPEAIGASATVCLYKYV